MIVRNANEGFPRDRVCGRLGGKSNRAMSYPLQPVARDVPASGILLEEPDASFRESVLCCLPVDVPAAAVADLSAYPACGAAPPAVIAVGGGRVTVAVSWVKGIGRGFGPLVVAVLADISPEAVDRSLAAGAGLVLPRCRPAALARMLEETVVRIRAATKAKGGVGAPGDRLRINPTERAAFDGSRPLLLSDTEFRLLRVLTSHPCVVLSRSTILSEMSGGAPCVCLTSLSFTVSALRKKLGPLASCVRSVWGRGYGWFADPAAIPGRHRRSRRRKWNGIGIYVLSLVIAFGTGILLFRRGDPKPDESAPSGNASEFPFFRNAALACAIDGAADGHGAELAVDGDPDTWFQCFDPQSEVAALMIIWKTPQSGTVRVLCGRTDGEQEESRAWRAEVSMNGTDWTTATATSLYGDSCVFIPAAEFRYLRIRPATTSKTPWVVREVFVTPE